MRTVLMLLQKFVKDESGLSTVEVILILVVLVSLVIIFREEMIGIVEDVFKSITKKVNKIT